MYLLDTHALIWAITDDSALSTKARDVILSKRDVFVSIASLWEIAIKKNIHKLEMDLTIGEIAEVMRQINIRILNIETKHLDLIEQLPDIHRDPFDRLLVVQSQADHLTIVTKDSNIAQYDVETLW